MSYENEGVGSTPSAEIERKTLEEIMKKLVSISDVSGAAIFRKDGSFVSWRTKDGMKPTQDIDEIKTQRRTSLSLSYQEILLEDTDEKNMQIAMAVMGDYGLRDHYQHTFKDNQDDMSL